MKRRHVLGIAAILAFITFSAFTFQDSLTPYVNFAQAKAMAGSVQVRGTLVNGDVTLAEGGRLVRFVLRDEAGEEVPVAYRGTKPDNMEHATSIVAVGRYRQGQFEAEKLLVKCPSKYERAQKGGK